MVKDELSIYKEFLDLCEKFRPDLGKPEICSCMIKFASKYFFDLAVNDETAFKIIQQDVEEGWDWHIKELDVDE